MHSLPVHQIGARPSITFPKRFEVILCHNANPETRYFPTVHAGLLFHSGTGYVYIEKTGGSGPFVRLDIEDKSDLIAWLSWKANKREVGYDFVTFSDSIIELLPKSL